MGKYYEKLTKVNANINTSHSYPTNYTSFTLQLKYFLNYKSGYISSLYKPLQKDVKNHVYGYFNFRDEKA